MLSAMSANSQESSNVAENPVFNNVAENLCRHNKSGRYYALFKRGGKQIRKSLKTNDKDLAKRKLTDLRASVANLTTDGETRNITFTDLSERWLEKQKPTLKESSYRRIKNCIDGLAAFFKNITFKPLRKVGQQTRGEEYLLPATSRKGVLWLPCSRMPSAWGSFWITSLPLWISAKLSQNKLKFQPKNNLRN